MHKSIGYHTRLQSDNRIKVTGGSFSGSIDSETIERLASTFTVTVKGSGRPVFVDREGREVSLYVTIDPQRTNIGARALQNYRIAKENADRAAYAKQKEQEAEIEELMDALPHEEIVKRLKGT